MIQQDNQTFFNVFDKYLYVLKTKVQRTLAALKIFKQKMIAQIVCKLKHYLDIY